MLHRVDSLLESRVPIVLDGVIGTSHQFLRDERPFLEILVPENKQNPLLGLRPLSPLDLGV